MMTTVCHATLAACYQLAQSILKIISALAERVGQGQWMGVVTLWVTVHSGCWSWLVVESPGQHWVSYFICFRGRNTPLWISSNLISWSYQQNLPWVRDCKSNWLHPALVQCSSQDCCLCNIYNIYTSDAKAITYFTLYIISKSPTR